MEFFCSLTFGGPFFQPKLQNSKPSVDFELFRPRHGICFRILKNDLSFGFWLLVLSRTAYTHHDRARVSTAEKAKVENWQ
jgi:hypothetical protein